ncbi:hypothetical protein [Bartonella sp. MU37NMGALS]|uniref:hypothetical protein n=1 Tax=Bartonella sp. MU37NMGALS TaxID=3243560 RepID=UPI0035D0DEEF
MSNINDRIKDVEENVSLNSLNWDKKEEAYNAGRGVDKNKKASKIINVEGGKVEEGSKEAVNGDQLHDYTKKQTDMILDKAKEYTYEKVSNIVKDAVKKVYSYTEIKFAALSYTVGDVRKEARQVAAIDLAVSNLSYEDTLGL